MPDTPDTKPVYRQIASVEESRAAIDEVIGTAQKLISIFDYDLDHRGFGDPLRIEKLRRLPAARTRAPPADRPARAGAHRAARSAPRGAAAAVSGRHCDQPHARAGAQRDRPLRARRRPQRLAPAALHPAARRCCAALSAGRGAAARKVRGDLGTVRAGRQLEHHWPLNRQGFPDSPPSPRRVPCGNISRWLQARRSGCCAATSAAAAVTRFPSLTQSKGPTK